MWTLYIANKNYSSWSLRPWVLMRELDIPFAEKILPFDDHAPGDIKAVSPSGKVPCLVDGEAVIWDSLAIAEYVAESYPQAWPDDRRARGFARSVAAEMHSGFQTVRNVCGMNCGVRVRLRTISPALNAEWARIDALWCEGLSRFGGPFLAGDRFTAADAFYAPIAFRVMTYSPALSAVANGYADRLRALPSMREWYSAALVEPWRDGPHEAEVREHGDILEDLRKPA
jgi:glutathione S-transferase